jgi:SAM-dependent methyltransferase
MLQQDWDVIWERKNKMSQTVNFGRNFYNKFFSRLLLKNLEKDALMLEIGCGTGSIAATINYNLKYYIGVDNSSAALSICKNINTKNKNFFVCGDAFSLPFKDESFDLVWSQGLIEHFDNPEEIVNEHLRVCKKGGTVLISAPYKYSYFIVWWWLTRPRLLRFLWPWTEQEFYTNKKYNTLMKNRNKYYEITSYHFLGIIILKIIK